MLPDIQQIAEDTSNIVQKIICGDAFAYSPEIQEWAWGVFARLDPFSDGNDPLTEAVIDCLIDIMSCDNATWDTPIRGFVEDLHKLKVVLGSETG